MDAHPAPAWLARLVDRVQDRLVAWTQTPVVGHADWEAQNLALTTEGRPLAVHDWDSACVRPEPGIAGLAAAVFPRDGAVPCATLTESGDFLDAYEQATGRPWMLDDHEVAWAAGLWVLAHEAWAESMSPAATGPVLELLSEEGEQRLRLAGA